MSVLQSLLDVFGHDEKPLLVTFFTRLESLCGLHQLVALVTKDPEVVTSPWSAACGSLVIRPRHYLERGRTKHYWVDGSHLQKNMEGNLI